MKLNIDAYIWHIANSIFFMYQRKFSSEWDRRLNQLLEHGTVTDANHYTITIVHHGVCVEVWCENRWYSFGYANRVNGNCVASGQAYRPRIKTMIRLWNIYQQEREKRPDDYYLKLFKEWGDD